MPTIETLLAWEGCPLLNIRESDVFGVLAGVPWARTALAEYVKQLRPALFWEVRPALRSSR